MLFDGRPRYIRDSMGINNYHIPNDMYTGGSENYRLRKTVYGKSSFFSTQYNRIVLYVAGIEKKFRFRRNFVH